MPESIGHYEVDRVLENGAVRDGLARAQRSSLDAQVAIKVLAENWAHDDNVRERFAEEARVLWRHDSDRAIRVHLVDELDDGRPYFVIDLPPSAAAWPSSTASPSGRATGTQYSIDEALASDHRDRRRARRRPPAGRRAPRPEAVERALPVDASHHGDARAPSGWCSPTSASRAALDAATPFTIAAGTPHYMLTEQSEGRADERSDVYAAGVLLYELLTGLVPYPYQSVGAVMRAQLTEIPAPISSVRDDARVRSTRVARHALAAEPDRRSASASEWADAFAACSRATRVNVAGGRPRSRVRGPTRVPPRRSVRPPGSPPPPLLPVPVPGVAGAGSAAAAAGGGAARPPAPPPVPAPTPPTPPSGRSGGGSKRRRNSIIAAVLVVVLITAVVGVAVLSSGDEATAGEIFLDPRDGTRRRGQRSVRSAEHRSERRRAEGARDLIPNAVPPPPPVGGAIPSTSGAEPGLYGGTRDSSVCDPTKLITFLQENAAKAKAWANTLGVTVAEHPQHT